MHLKTPKVLLATGMQSAIGQALSRRMQSAPERWRIISTSRTARAGALPGAGPNESIEWLSVDLRRPLTEVRARLRDAMDQRELSTINGVVHLAGLVYSDAWNQTTDAEWSDMVAVNLTGAAALLQAVDAYLARGASVVLVSSVDAHKASLDGPAAAYGAAKAGLEGMARHLAVEWGQRGVRVNVVAPGALSSGSGPASAGAVAENLRRTALGRLGDADEVAAAIHFLLGAEASYITGIVLPVDGGLGLGY